MENQYLQLGAPTMKRRCESTFVKCFCPRSQSRAGPKPGRRPALVCPPHRTFQLEGFVLGGMMSVDATVGAPAPRAASRHARGSRVHVVRRIRSWRKGAGLAHARGARGGGTAYWRMPVEPLWGSLYSRVCEAVASSVLAGISHVDGVGGRSTCGGERGSCACSGEAEVAFLRGQVAAMGGLIRESAQHQNTLVDRLAALVGASRSSGQTRFSMAAPSWCPTCSPGDASAGSAFPRDWNGTVFYSDGGRHGAQPGAQHREAGTGPHVDAERTDKVAPQLVAPGTGADEVGMVSKDPPQAAEATGAQRTPSAGAQHAGQAAPMGGRLWRAGAAGAESAARQVAESMARPQAGPYEVCELVRRLPQALLAEAAQCGGGGQDRAPSKSVEWDVDAWVKWQADWLSDTGESEFTPRLDQLAELTQRAVDGASARVVYAAFRREAERLQEEVQPRGSAQAGDALAQQGDAPRDVGVQGGEGQGRDLHQERPGSWGTKEGVSRAKRRRERRRRGQAYTQGGRGPGQGRARRGVRPVAGSGTGAG